ncbi:hypothetical protein [Gryllotalpicola koreensis]|uniref:Uncharacterized protein n=1 Tax=Gryllotalpicola koreensis TaxID=993086 RepID=A0ABP7ZPH5_9MICO
MITSDRTFREGLIALLDELRPGDWLALASRNAPLLENAAELKTGLPLDRLAAEVFEFLPVSGFTRRPLRGWTVDESSADFADDLRAVQGLAGDATGRRMTVDPISDAVLVDHATTGIRAVLRTASAGAPFVFLICVGGGTHQPTDLELVPQPLSSRQIALCV